MNKKTTRVLLSEGTSLTSRETLTCLNKIGYKVEIMTSSKMAVSSFSGWKNKTIKVENLNVHVCAYLEQVEKLMETGVYSALLPTHEQAWLFAAIRLSAGGELPAKLLIVKAGVKTHGTMALLLGCAEKTKRQREVIKTFFRCIKKTGNLDCSIEVLTPVKKDKLSSIPLLFMLLQLLIKPDNASRIATKAMQNYSVMPETIKKIHSLLYFIASNRVY